MKIHRLFSSVLIFALAISFGATAASAKKLTFSKNQPPVPLVEPILNLIRTSNPVSTSVVHGTNDVALLGFRLQVNRSGTIRSMKVRLLADDDGNFDNNGFGDTAADTIVQNVELWEITSTGSMTRFRGPSPLRLAGRIGGPRGYFEATFNNINVSSNAILNLVVVADTLNISAPHYVAADIHTSGVVAKTLTNQNYTIKANGQTPGQVNYAGGSFPPVVITVIPSIIRPTTLDLSLASTPVSSTYVKGQRNVDVLGISATAGNGDVRIVSLSARITGDDDGTFNNNGYGDTAANTLVDSVSLYKVDAQGVVTRISGPVGLSLVGTIGANGGHYKAEFRQFTVNGTPVPSINISASTTEKFLIRTDLRTSISATRYLAADVLSADVAAQDQNGNTLSVTGTVNNLGNQQPGVVATIATSGTLTGSSEGNPIASILSAGATAQPVSKYKFTATNEAFTVQKLDVVMDEDNNFSDTPETTYARSLTRVGLAYTDSAARLQTQYATISNGKAQFTNLDIHVPNNGSSFVTILVDLNTIPNGAVAGDMIRLGLNEQFGAANNSFEALGFISAEKKTVTDLQNYTASSTVNTHTIIRPTTLDLSLASTPVSSTYIRGQANVDVLGFNLHLRGEDVDVSTVKVRLVGDDDGNFIDRDVAANTIVDSISLWKVHAGTESRISGPVGLTAVGQVGTSTGYYEGTFSTNEQFVEDQTTKYLIRANLRSSISAPRYLAADIVAGVDGIQGNTVHTGHQISATINGSNTGSINNLDSANQPIVVPSIVLTIATSGILTGTSEGNPNAAILIGGATGQVVSKYKFTALNEAFEVQRLDVVMDDDLNFGDTPETTYARALTRIGLRYSDRTGSARTVYANLAAGKAQFTNLGIYVPRDGSSFVTIIADLNTIPNGAQSGDKIRLGLNEQTTTANNSFRALGLGSNESKNVLDLTTYPGSSTVQTHILRNAAPTVATLTTLGAKLNNGANNDLSGITVAVDAGRSISLKRIVFEFSSSAMDVNALGLYRKVNNGAEFEITTDVSIRNRAGQNLKFGGSNLATAGAPTTNHVYITWDKNTIDHETIPGTTNAYILRGTIANAAANESLSTFISDDTAGFTAPTNGVANLRTNTESLFPSSAHASINGTRTVWYWTNNNSQNCPNYYLLGCVVLDSNGDGLASIDPTQDLILQTHGTTAALQNGTIIPGALRYTSDNIGGSSGQTGIYFDLNGDGIYSGTEDIAISVTPGTGVAPVNNALVVDDIRWNAAGGQAYIDTNFSGNSYNFYDPAYDVLIQAWPSGSAPIVRPQDDEFSTSGFNFVWSDNSALPHTMYTNDWFNGFNVNQLPVRTGSFIY